MDESSDYALALSIAQAIETDGELIAALLEEEEQAARDHAWAQRLAQDPRAVADAGGNACTNHINEEELGALRHFNVPEAEADAQVPVQDEATPELLPSPIIQASAEVKTTDTIGVEAPATPEAGPPNFSSTTAANEADATISIEDIATPEAESPVITATTITATTIAAGTEAASDSDVLAIPEAGSQVITATTAYAEVSSDIEGLPTSEARSPTVVATTAATSAATEANETPGLEAFITPEAGCTDVTVTATEVDRTPDEEVFVTREDGSPIIIATAAATEILAIPELDVPAAAQNDSSAGPSNDRKECISCSDDLLINELFVFTSCSHGICHPCLTERLQATFRDETLFPFQCCNQEITIEQGYHISDELY
ncbi:hypothetical protein FGRMN_8413 [Fusarium graminum]|nr:hypothetical protein FGRMN_8413 [Fusarium graminum]